MKSCYIFGVFSILIATTTAAPSLVDGVIEDILNKKLEELRALMKTGDPELGIPVLAPFESDYFPNAFGIDGVINWKGVFTNLRVDNMDTFINHKLTFNMLTMKSKFNFTFPDIVAQGFMDIRGHMFEILPHWAYGDFYVAPVNVQFFGDCKMSINRDGFLNMDRITAEMHMDEFNSKMDNLVTGGDLSELLNRVIPDIVPSAMDNFPERFTAKLEKKILPIANKIFNKINIKDIMRTHNMEKNFN